MVYDPGSLEAALSAAVGTDAALIADLRRAFIESASRQIDLMERSRCDANWTMAALKLKGLCASFGVTEMIRLVDQALDGAPGDPAVLRKLSRALSFASAEH